MRLQTQLRECCLRPWMPEDRSDLVRHANNQNVWRNLTDDFPHPYGTADADFWIRFANQDAPRLHFAIEYGKVAIGGIGITAGEGLACRTGQFGYWIGEEYWGKGIGTAVARAMVDYARQYLHFTRLEAPVFEWNSPSMRILEKIGFVRDGVLKRSSFKDKQLINSVIYSLVLST
jgi:ribosomal-protein-alanine N-acetyltransferase